MTIKKRGDSYVVRVELGRDAQGKRVQEYKRFKELREAREYEAQVISRIASGRPGKLSDQTLSDFVWTRYLPAVEARGARPSTVYVYGRYWRLHILPVLGRVKLKDITVLMLDDFYKGMLERSHQVPGREHKKLSPHTVAHAHTQISQALGAAVKWGLLATNVALSASPPRKRVWAKSVQAWNETEVTTYLGWLRERDDRMFALWFLLATTGMRRGEALGLQWQDIDWEDRTITIERALVTGVDGQLELAPTKTVKGARTLRVGSDLLDELRRHERSQKLERWAAGERWNETPFVFRRVDGRPCVPAQISQRFRDQLSVAM